LNELTVEYTLHIIFKTEILDKSNNINPIWNYGIISLIKSALIYWDLDISVWVFDCHVICWKSLKKLFLDSIQRDLIASDLKRLNLSILMCKPKLCGTEIRILRD